MEKIGFRGERKRILTPSLSQGEGECGDGKSEGIIREFGNLKMRKWGGVWGLRGAIVGVRRGSKGENQRQRELY